MDSPEFILTGGEDGKAIVPGKPGEGELLRRLLLPLDNEDHMPPKEKTQLSATEIEILDWWISTGADVHKKIKELPQSEKAKQVSRKMKECGIVLLPQMLTMMEMQILSPVTLD